MNFYFTWTAIHVETQEIEAKYQQTIYGEDLADAVANFTAMHGDLWEDEKGVALEITCIKEVP